MIEKGTEKSVPNFFWKFLFRRIAFSGILFRRVTSKQNEIGS